MISSRFMRRRIGPCAILLLGSTMMLTACNRNLAPGENVQAPDGGASRERQKEAGPDERVFGDLELNRLLREGFGGNDEGGSLPVNKYLWQATLDTLGFLPLVSTDPFTGVIATDWAGTPDAPNERVKVTAYLTKPDLAASSLKVAVFRQVADGRGGWQAAGVNPETALRLENAILARARQLRVAEKNQETG